MNKYVVGYYNKPNKKDFVILATMESENVAMFVRDSYNDAYKRAGINTSAVMFKYNEVPKPYRYTR